MTEGAALDPNPDLILQFSLLSPPHSQSPATTNSSITAEYALLLSTLRSARCSALGRPGAKPSDEVLVFVKADEALIRELAEKERVDDWLNGVGSTEPVPTGPRDYTADPIHPATRLRLIHSHLVPLLPATSFPHLLSLFPPHSPSFLSLWASQWTWTTLSIPSSSLTLLATTLGPQIALYFAFLQTYLQFLVFPAGLGLLFALSGRAFDPVYSVGLAGWAVVFLESWRLKEMELSVLWGTHSADRVEKKRKEWKGSQERTTLLRAIVSAAVAVAFAAGLVALVSVIYAVETIIGETYHGQGKPVLALLPTVLFVGVVPQFTGLWHATAERLTSWEDHALPTRHAASLATKVFALHFFVAYGSLLLTSFVYIPFGPTLVPLLLSRLSSSTFHPSSSSYSINTTKLRTQIFAYTLTNQAVGAFTEVGLPFLLSRAKKSLSKTEKVKGYEDEKEWLEQVREQTGRPEYEVFGDYNEMAVQWGYLVLFGTIWPVAPLWSLINNFFELRGDAFKLSKQSRRPVPTREATIGPWLEIMSFLSYFGALTHTALVYLYRPSSPLSTSPKTSSPPPTTTETLSKLFTALLLALVAEKVYNLFRAATRVVLQKTVWEGGWAEGVLEAREREGRKLAVKGVLESAGDESKGIVGGKEGTAEFWIREDEGMDWVKRKEKVD